eukprot:841078-Pelagomonas_calceolata.AAC.1
MSMVFERAAVRAQASAPSLPMMPEWALNSLDELCMEVIPHPHMIKGLLRNLGEAGCTIGGN